MKHQVLARKWRPKRFTEVLGQQHVLRALVNSLDMGRLHHAYLFSGTRGVGKTSIARLLAKSLNCEQGVSSSPCGICNACQEIEQGRFVDLLEIDAASRTRVEDTRELLDNVQYLPTRARFKVYLIDEVHMLSRHSFNALLKTLEEPPEHVKFLLATTDPQKLPITILSRCLQFNLKPLQQKEIQTQLEKVLSQEGLEYETAALTLLAKAAAGSVRDALSLTEQALAYGSGQILSQAVSSMLGVLDEDKLAQVLHFILQGDSQSVMQWVDDLSAWGADYSSVLQQVLSLLHSIARSQLLAEPLPEPCAIFANKVDPQQVQLYYQILSMSAKDLSYASDPRCAFEMALLRVLSFSPEPALVKPVPIHTQLAPRATHPQNAGSQVLESQQSSADNKLVQETHLQQAHSQTTLQQATEKGETDLGQQSTTLSELETQVTFEIEQSTDYASAEQELEQVLTQAQMQHTSTLAQAPSENTQESLSSHAQVKQSSAQAKSSVNSLAEHRGSEVQELLASHHQLRSHRLKKSAQAVQLKPVVQAELNPAPEPASAAPNEQASMQKNIQGNHFVKKIEPASEAQSRAPEIQSKTQQEQRLAEEGMVRAAPSPSPSQVEQKSSVIETSHEAQVLHDAEHWQNLIDTLNFAPIYRQLLLNSSICKRSDGIHVVVQPALQKLLEPQVAETLVQALSPSFSLKVMVYSSANSVGETPIEWQRRRHQEKLAVAKQQLLADPHVLWFSQQYGAILDDGSVNYI